MRYEQVSPYAGFRRRLGAGVLDYLISIPPYWLILFLFEPGPITRAAGGEWNLLTVLLVGSFYWIYKAGLESSGAQATFGKQALDIYVTNLDGGRISFARASLRAWPWYLSIFALYSDSVTTFMWIVALIAIVAAAFTRRKQGFHDLMAECLVVREGFDLRPGKAGAGD